MKTRRNPRYTDATVRMLLNDSPVFAHNALLEAAWDRGFPGGIDSSPEEVSAFLLPLVRGSR